MNRQHMGEPDCGHSAEEQAREIGRRRDAGSISTRQAREQLRLLAMTEVGDLRERSAPDDGAALSVAISVLAGFVALGIHAWIWPGESSFLAFILVAIVAWIVADYFRFARYVYRPWRADVDTHLERLTVVARYHAEPEAEERE